MPTFVYASNVVYRYTAGKTLVNGFSFDGFAKTYDAHRYVGGPYVPVLASLATRLGAERVLEIGCGTGNSTAGFLDAYPCSLVGCDISAPMLRKAREKVPGVSLLRAEASALPVGSDSADMIFGVLMIQHVSDHDALVGECGRALRGGGGLAFVTAPYAFIHEHFLNAYFPSFAAIDAPRFRRETDVAACLERQGFGEVTLDYVESPAVPVDAAYLEKVRGKFISTIRLVPDAEFDEGIARLEADIAAYGGQLPEPIVWRAVVVSGIR